MKKYRGLWAIVVCCLLLGGCSLSEYMQLKGVNTDAFLHKEEAVSPTPAPTERPDGCEGAALDFLEALKNGERNRILLFSDEVPGYTGDFTHPLFRAAYSSLDWKLQGFKEGKSGYTLTVELTVRDMRGLLEELYGRVEREQTPGCDRVALCDRLLQELIAETDYPTLTKRETVTFTKATGTWRIRFADDFYNAAAGYLPQALKEFDLPTALLAETPLEDSDAAPNQRLIWDALRKVTLLTTCPNDPAGYRMDLECVNTADGARVFAVKNIIVNGYVLDSGWNATLSAGETLRDSLFISRAALENCGITTVKNIYFTLETFTTHAWPVYPELSMPCAVYPHGRDDSLAPMVEREGQKRLLDSWCAGFTVLDVIDEGCWGVTALVAVDNRCDAELWFGVGELTVDGRAFDPGWRFLLPAHCRGVERLRIPAGEILRSGCESVDTLDFRVFVSDLLNIDSKDAGISAGGRYQLGVRSFRQ